MSEPRAALGGDGGGVSDCDSGDAESVASDDIECYPEFI